ncbi:sensor histidine kinase [Dongia sedimenti]|uniref:histidine kinase n=1 Tax=Dongia sedimenti TaxID=3064282 RepID=A0ABU0YPV4_9PROT|nr:PAS domain-containing sensor histidine kinase [Rhodospirillaceae bacterium R-7]
MAPAQTPAEGPPVEGRADADLFALLVESVTDQAIYMLDTRGIVRSWNAGAAALKGYSAAEIIGQDFAIFYTDADRARDIPRRALAEAELSGRYCSRGIRQRKDGTCFLAEVKIYPVRNADGDLTGFAKVTRDLTTQLAADEALANSEQQLRLLIDSVTDRAIYRLDRTGRVASWNAGAQKIKGYSAAEIIGQDFSVFYTREHRHWGKPKHALMMAERNGRFQERGVRVRKDGSLFTAEVEIYPIRDSDGVVTGFAKVTRDLTEEERRAELESRSNAKSNFLAHLSHEFRTPLNAIIGFSDLIRNERLGPIPIKRYVGYGVDINDSALHLLELAVAILDLTRLEAGKLLPQYQPIDFDPLVETVARVIAHKAADCGVALDFDIGRDLAGFRADPRMVRQCLINLLDNAIKFSKPGGTVRLAIDRADDRLRITVTDTGKGMREADIPQALQPFRQIGNPTTSPMEGVGLGLSLVKSFCDLHDATLSLRSAPGRGTEVILAFPYPGGAGDEPAMAAGSDRRKHDVVGWMKSR